MSPRLPARLLAAQSDRRLLELVQAGNERAFDAIVQRYRRQLLRYCGRMGLSDSRSEDVLQHSLLSAWMSLERGTEVRELRPWLYRIVHNTAVNTIRRAGEEHAPLQDSAHSDLALTAESELERRIAVRAALSDVAALPQMQRDAILMSAVDGRSHREVASALGVTDGAVRGLLYRARATLRGAAAALTPQPLLAWASGSAGRLSQGAGRIAEYSGAAGGSDAGGALLKGAAVAVTTALAAGVVLVPSHHTRTTSPRKPAASTAQRRSPETGGISTGAITLASVRQRATRGAAPRTIAPQAPRGSHRAPARSPHGASAPLYSRGTGGAKPVSVLNPVNLQPGIGAGPGKSLGGHGADGGASAGSGGRSGSGSDGGGGSRDSSGSSEGASLAGSGSSEDPTHSGTGSGGEQTSGGSAEGVAGSEQEKAEREAEAARERSEREAEEARERTEQKQEAEAAQKQGSGKDS